MVLFGPVASRSEAPTQSGYSGRSGQIASSTNAMAQYSIEELVQHVVLRKDGIHVDVHRKREWSDTVEGEAYGGYTSQRMAGVGVEVTRITIVRTNIRV